MPSSPPSFKELVKAINSFLPAARLPLPDDLVELIEAYVRKHDEHDDSIAEKVHGELVSIYQKDVLGHRTRYAPFMNILRRLRPLFTHPKRTVVWWQLLRPASDVMYEEKDLAEESQAIVLDILTADLSGTVEGGGEGPANTLVKEMMVMWLAECEVAGRAEDSLGNFREKLIRDTLCVFGKRHPKAFMTIVDGFMVQKKYRARTLHLMSDFIRNGPPHIHMILQTPLFNTLLNCLQLDTSTTIVSLALTVLTMILPHMPSSLVTHLPALFNIYARLLFWERELTAVEAGIDLAAERRITANTASWERMGYAPEFDGSTIPHLLDYFTILYGLYPINFMDYIRKPQRYLRHAETPNSDDIEVQPTEIRHASEQYRQCHALHENFYTLTIETEITERRWVKSEPAEIVAECMALRHILGSADNSTTGGFGMPGLPTLSVEDDMEREGPDSALLSSSMPLGSSTLGGLQNDSWRNAHTLIGSPTSSRVQSTIFRQSSQSSHQSQRDSSSTRPSRRIGDSPTLPPSGSSTNLQDMLHSNKVIKSGLSQSLANDSVPSLALSHQESIPEQSIPTHQLHEQGTAEPASMDEAKDTQIEHLKSQVLLLHNDLTFERFMKQQHLTHMGELRRRQVREAASEAEAQNLIMHNRTLKKRLEEAKKTETQVKKDSEKSRTLAKKWEADLSTKLRTIRDEQRRWTAEGDTLRKDVEKARVESEALRKLVCDAEVREIGWKQQMQYVEASRNEMQRLKSEVDRLTKSERNLQAQETARQAAATCAVEADSRAETLQVKLRACELDLQQTHELYQSQIVVLNAKLQDAVKNGAERHMNTLKAQLDIALNTSRTQQVELRKRISELTKKNTALNATVLDFQSKMPPRSMSDPQRPSSSELEMSLLSAETDSPLSFRSRQQRGFSDPDTFDATSYNPTPPLEPYDAIFGAQPRRPSTPANAEVLSSPSGKVSPTTERYHGRGGIQNVVRKERKEKKDDKDKDRKKSGGIRGIRGFV